MSVHSQTVAFTDSEYAEITAALKLMIDHCDVMLANGPVQPFTAGRQHCEAILGKLLQCREPSSPEARRAMAYLTSPHRRASRRPAERQGVPRHGR